MPFQSNQTMPENPTIRIFFHGLIVLESPDGKSCVAEIHHAHGGTHTLSIEVRAKMPGQADFILMRHFGPLDGSHPALSIKGDKSAASSAAFKYEPTSTFDPANPSHGERDDDFRWTINLEGRGFHDGDLKVETTETRPSVALLEGAYYFHTALIKKGDIAILQDTTLKRRIKGLASVVGANLYLDDGGVAVVSGANFELPLTKPTDKNASYEIYIDNSPLFEPPGAAASHSELKEYYKVLKRAMPNDIPQRERFNLDFPPVLPLREGEEVSLQGSSKFDTQRASIRIPCMPIVLDGNG